MRHMMIPASWKSAGALKKVIETKEQEGWSVAALGEISGSNVLIMVDDGRKYEHEIIQIFWSLRGKIAEILAEKQKTGWFVATVGNCLGSSMMVIKRVVGGSSEEIEFLLDQTPKNRPLRP